MKDLFLKRKQAFRKECLGYLRYVLNDHFCLIPACPVGLSSLPVQPTLATFS